jgi:hypothetical protein
MPEVTARPPTLMKMRSAESRVAPTLTSFGDSKRAWPSKTAQFSVVFSQVSSPVRDSPEMRSLRALMFHITLMRPGMVAESCAARHAAGYAF